MIETERVGAAVAALEAGKLVVIPTDTVYGLACSPDDDAAVRRLSALKGRDSAQPIALVAATVDALVELVPELRGESETVARSLLPGPFTLVFPNPSRRLPSLAGAHAATIGVRVPLVSGTAKAVLEKAVAVAATSANVHGGPDPRRIDQIPPELLSAVDAVVDGGELPGTPSTVLDLTGCEPTVIREGAVKTAEALARVARARGQ